jgi:hypothetical protein
MLHCIKLCGDAADETRSINVGAKRIEVVMNQALATAIVNANDLTRGEELALNQFLTERGLTGHTYIHPINDNMNWTKCQITNQWSDCYLMAIDTIV